MLFSCLANTNILYYIIYIILYYIILYYIILYYIILYYIIFFIIFYYINLIQAPILFFLVLKFAEQEIKLI